MVLTVSFVLSPVIGLSCHRRWQIRHARARSGRLRLRKLDAGVEASGPHDFAVRSIIDRQRAVDRSQIRRTRPAITLRAQRCRVHRIPPRVRDDRASAPSVGRDSSALFLFLPDRQASDSDSNARLRKTNCALTKPCCGRGVPCSNPRGVAPRRAPSLAKLFMAAGSWARRSALEVCDGLIASSNVRCSSRS
jgi:hypothetical protein